MSKLDPIRYDSRGQLLAAEDTSDVAEPMTAGGKDLSQDGAEPQTS